MSTIPDDVVMTDAERATREQISRKVYGGRPLYGPTPRRFDVLAPEGSERRQLVTAPLRSAPFRVGSKLPGAKAAESARLHLTMFGHWPTNAAGSTVSEAGAVVKAAACAVCHPEKVKRAPAAKRAPSVPAVPAPVRADCIRCGRVAELTASLCAGCAERIRRERDRVSVPAERVPTVAEVIAAHVPIGQRTAERVAAAEVAAAPTTSEECDDVSVPTDDERIRAYLDRLIYEPKRVYALEYVAHRVAGAPAPADPGAAWAGKVRSKVDRMVAS